MQHMFNNSHYKLVQVLAAKMRTSLRCFCNNNGLKTVIIFCPVIAFLIILTAFLKRSTYFIPFENVESFDKPKMGQMTAQNNTLPVFPSVHEFRLDSKIKRFDNEEARVVGFPTKVRENTTSVNVSTKIIYLKTTYFKELNPKHFYFFHLGNGTFARYQCPVSNCFVTKHPFDIRKADAVMFHVRDLEVYSLPQYRTSDQVWILYSMEPPWLEVTDMRRFNGLFNWTMSYRRNSDVLMKYGFIGQKQTDADDRTASFHSIWKKKIDKAVWFVSNCNTDSNREQYVEHLKKIYPVDVIGGCGKEGCRPAETKKCYTEMANRYKFYLSFENAVCQDYVTEKLYNPLEYHIIPVTLGGADYSSLTPNYSIINAMEFASPEDLGKYLWKVSRNETLYQSYFTWKSKYRSYLQPWMCDLCEKLHDPLSPRTNYDLENWWNEGGSCLRWTTSGFKPIEKHAFPQYHSRIFE